MKHKLSELTFGYVISLLHAKRFYMNQNESDCLREIADEQTFDGVKGRLMERWGDVAIIIDANEIWSKQVRIVDDGWKADHLEYIRLNDD